MEWKEQNLQFPEVLFKFLLFEFALYCQNHYATTNLKFSQIKSDTVDDYLRQIITIRNMFV